MPGYLHITQYWSISNGSPVPKAFLGKRGKVTKTSGGFTLEMLQPLPYEEYNKLNAAQLQYKPKAGLTVGVNINLGAYNNSKKKFTQKRYVTACCTN